MAPSQTILSSDYWVREGCVFAPNCTCTDHVLGGMSQIDYTLIGSEMSIGAVRITDLDFDDDEVIFPETTDILLQVLGSLEWEAEPLGFRGS